jgi:hypothetical protein
MFGFMKKRVAKPQKAARTEEMTNLKQEELLASAQSPDEKPKYSYHDSFELPPTCQSSGTGSLDTRDRPVIHKIVKRSSTP